MTGVLPCGAVSSIPEAIDQLTAIDDALPAADGVKAFNHMYLVVTTAVRAAVSAGFFGNSAFLDRLDVVFANRYFGALGRAQRGEAVPRCWDVLWRRRDRDGVAPLQFAFAGMNAHINHDLVLAVVETLDEFAATPHDATLHRDFRRVNEVLAELEGDIRRSFEHGIALRLERRCARVEDHVDAWSIGAARAAAWQDARLLWRVRRRSAVRARYEKILDEAVAAAGRCLLSPLHHPAGHDGRACGAQGPVLGPTPEAEFPGVDRSR